MAYGCVETANPITPLPLPIAVSFAMLHGSSSTAWVLRSTSPALDYSNLWIMYTLHSQLVSSHLWVNAQTPMLRKLTCELCVQEEISYWLNRDGR